MKKDDNCTRTYIGGLPEAEVASLENAAAELIREFEKRPEGEPLSSRSWEPERVPQFQVGEENIVGNLIIQEPDPDTFQIINIIISMKSGAFELKKPGCEMLDQLAERWASHPRIRGLSNHKAIRDRLIRWCSRVLESDRYSSCVDHILNRLRSEVGIHEIWIQLADIDVQDRVPMGAVELRGIDEASVDKWIDNLSDDKLIEPGRSRLRKKLKEHWQGETAAVYRGTGDLPAVEESAVEHTERACAMLRMLEPGNRSAIQRSYLQPLTLVSQTGVRAVLTDPQTHEFSSMRKSIDTPPVGITIEWDRFSEKWENGGLRKLHELLSADPPSPFQEHLVRAILIYSRHRLTCDPIEKLIFAFVGVETMLLAGDKTSKIVAPLKRRLGAAVGIESAERDEFNGLVNRAHRMRSDFLHHGHSLEDRKTVQKFLSHSWAFFTLAIENHTRWKSISEYCAALDSS